MIYRVEIDLHAKRQFKKLDHALQARLRPHLAGLAENPKPNNSKILKGGNVQHGRSLRVGKSRILYWIDDASMVVTIYDVDARSRVYKDLS